MKKGGKSQTPAFSKYIYFSLIPKPGWRSDIMTTAEPQSTPQIFLAWLWQTSNKDGMLSGNIK